MTGRSFATTGSRLAGILLLLLFVLSGCQRRPLEIMSRASTRVIVKTIWDIDIQTSVGVETEIEKPTGVTLYFFRNGEFYNQITTSNVDSLEVQLEEGRYKMYMISQSPDEFWRMQFEHMTDFANADVYLRENTNTPWAVKAAGDVVVENPEILFAGVSDEFDITVKMTEDYQYYASNLARIRAASTKGGTKSEDELYYEERIEYYTVHIPIKATNIVSQLWVTIYSGNIDALQSMRASTSGMARNFELTQDKTGSEEAIQVIREWRLTVDDPVRRVGHVDGIITTFGLPNGELPSADRDPALNVSALLIDNATVADFRFEVGDKLKLLKPNEGYRNLYRLVFGSVEEPQIVLPDVKPSPSSGGGGFVAGVEDWGEEQHAEVVL